MSKLLKNIDYSISMTIEEAKIVLDKLRPPLNALTIHQWGLYRKALTVLANKPNSTIQQVMPKPQEHKREDVLPKPIPINKPDTSVAEQKPAEDDCLDGFAEWLTAKDNKGN